MHICANIQKIFDTAGLPQQTLETLNNTHISDATHWDKEIYCTKTERTLMPIISEKIIH